MASKGLWPHHSKCIVHISGSSPVASCSHSSPSSSSPSSLPPSKAPSQPLSHLLPNQETNIKSTKYPHLDNYGSHSSKSLKAEIKTLAKIRHRNIVKILGFCHFDDSIFLISEFLQKGSLGESKSVCRQQFSCFYMPL
jgi:hypothetical protein